jgi:hypothetical protein
MFRFRPAALDCLCVSAVSAGFGLVTADLCVCCHTGFGLVSADLCVCCQRWFWSGVSRFECLLSALVLVWCQQICVETVLGRQAGK